MPMKTSIAGKSIISSMHDVAKEYFADPAYANVGCVTVGIKLGGARLKNGRVDDGGERVCYVGVSGAPGRTLLLASLIADGAVAANTTVAHVVGLLQVMAGTLVKYQSKKKSTVVQQQENWATHNCAEANLALFLFKSGVDMSQVTIASYEKLGNQVRYKALCHNCAQWVRQSFKVLADFDAAVKTV